MSALPPCADPAPVQAPSPPLCVGRHELARLLGVSLPTIDRHDLTGKLPSPVRLGRRRLWRLEEIHAWLAAGCPPRRAWQAMKAVGKH